MPPHPQAAVRDRFVALRSALGEDRFASLAEAHDGSETPLEALLERLQGSELAARRPELVDLARFELALTACEGREAHPRLSLDHMKQHGPEAWESLVLEPLPGTRLLRLDHPVHLFWEAVQSGDSPPVVAPAETHVRVWPGREGAAWTVIDEHEVRGLERLLEGSPLEQVCAAIAGPSKCLAEAAQRSWIVLEAWLADGVLAGLPQAPGPHQ